MNNSIKNEVKMSINKKMTITIIVLLLIALLWGCLLCQSRVLIETDNILVMQNYKKITICDKKMDKEYLFEFDRKNRSNLNLEPQIVANTEQITIKILPNAQLEVTDKITEQSFVIKKKNN